MIRNLASVRSGALPLCIRQQHTCFFISLKENGEWDIVDSASTYMARECKRASESSTFLTRLFAAALFSSPLSLLRGEMMRGRRGNQRNAEPEPKSRASYHTTSSSPSTMWPWPLVCLKACLYGRQGREGGREHRGHSNTHASEVSGL